MARSQIAEFRIEYSLRLDTQKGEGVLGSVRCARFPLQNERLANGMERLQLSSLWRRNKDGEFDHQLPLGARLTAVEHDLSINRYKLLR